MAEASDAHRIMMDAWNRRDWNAFVALLHPDYTYTGPDGSEQDGPEAGLRVAKKYAAAMPDGKVEITNLVVSGSMAVCEFTARGTHGGELEGIAATGRPIEVRVANFVELRDGKIYREREYMDAMTLMSQIGGVPARGSSAAGA